MCDCNESPFTKLRESWSRHYKTEMQQGKCDCCCPGQNVKSKDKGRFGVAYIIETPNRKCKPCGWEIEFNDTPSKIENSCEKMMNWITCPPLGACHNNNTNICYCSSSPKEILAGMQGPRYKSVNQTLCGCCKAKCGASGEDCSCKKQPKKSCCCQKEVNQNRCSQKTNTCCAKPKEKFSCCKGQQDYLKSKNKCTMCCCVLRSNERPCCCLVQKDDDECCCSKTLKRCQSDSQSSTEGCDCQGEGRHKTKNEYNCNCNCSACKCFTHTKTQTHTQTINNPRTTHQKSTDKIDHHKPSKNLLSLEPDQEKHKAAQRSPYTISTRDVPKKDPDKANILEELTQRLAEIKKPEILGKETNSEEAHVMESQILPETEKDIRIVDYENESPSQFIENNPSEAEIKDDNELNDKSYTTPKEDHPVKQSGAIEKPPKKKIKGSMLLKKIKKERKKEMQAIQPK